MHHLRLSVLSALATVLLVCPTVPLRVPSPRHDMVVKHKWDVIPDNWLGLGPPPDDNTIELHIALQPEHKDALADALHEVSQPGHPKYGAHLSKEKVAELVAPHPDTFELVTSWLEHNGVPPSSVSTTHGGGWLTVTDIPVSQANELLGASYQFYYHAGRNDTILRTVSYALPAALHVHVKTIIPTTAFTFTRPLQQTPRHHSEAAVLNATSGEPVNMLSRRQEGAIDPSVLRSQYKIGPYVPPVAANSRLGIVGYDYEYPNLKDQVPFRYYLASNLNEKPETVTFESINKNAPAGYAGKPANLFAEYTAALTYPLPITYYRGNGVRLSSIGAHKIIPGADDAIEQWLKYATEKENNPHTIGLIADGIRERNLPLEYMDAVCELFKRLGSRGTSVLVPSGDVGVGSGVSTKFCLSFPASCPSVTTVGGTTGIKPEPEVASIFSGGGFSYHFRAEDYQAKVVNAFVLSLGNMYSTRYVSWGRGVPDIAAQSSEYKYVYGGKITEMDSTFCSTSTAAAIFSLLNDYRIFNGFEPLGFLNPWLYGVGSIGLNDITIGNNPGARSQGFFATDGWDPVTGLGTPDFSELLDLNNPILLRPGQGPERRNGSFHDQP